MLFLRFLIYVVNGDMGQGLIEEARVFEFQWGDREGDK
jgi:hypothetical protein